MLYVTVPCIHICLLSEQVTFRLQPRKQLHALTPINANFMILSAVTYILYLLEVTRSHPALLWSPVCMHVGTPKL